MNHDPEEEELHDFRMAQLEFLEQYTERFNALRRSESRLSKVALGAIAGSLVTSLALVEVGGGSDRREFQLAVASFYIGVLGCIGAIVRMDRRRQQAEKIKQDSVEIVGQLGNVLLPPEMR